MGTDVLIAGGGVIGLTLARELAGRGLSVGVVDRREPGGGSAAHAAAGILSPTDPHEWEGLLGAFNAESLELWGTWAAELAAETGLDVGLETRGEVWVGPEGDAHVQAALRGTRAAGRPSEELDADGLRALEPGLQADGLTGVHVPDGAAVHVDRLAAALVASCRERGVTFARETIAGLEDGALLLASGERLPHERLVVATGAWTDLWLPEDLRPGLTPRLGESLVLRSPERPICGLAVRSVAGSVLPRADGTYWVGTTILERGHQELPGAASVRGILERAGRLLPAIDGALFVEARSGLRPASPTGLPIVGPVRDGIVLATGHGREGIIQAPLTARLVATGIAGGDWSATPPGFRPAP